MWSLTCPWCSEHKKSLVSELPDDFSHSLHHLPMEGIIPIQMRKSPFFGEKASHKVRKKVVPSKRGDTSTEGSGPSVEENVEILVSRTQVVKDSGTAILVCGYMILRLAQ